MNFRDAIRKIGDFGAIKRPEWNGYILRRNDGVAEYDPSSTSGYAFGTIVSFMANFYYCKQAVPSGEKAGPFSQSAWKRIEDAPHTLYFVRRSPSAESVSYHAWYDGSRFRYTPDDANLQMDGEFLDAILADDWIVGTEETFNAAKNPNDLSHVW